MATKGRADVKVKQRCWGTSTRREAETKVGLVDLSVSDVEILEEGGGLGRENNDIDKGYTDKQARRKRGMLFEKKSLGNENDGEKLSPRSSKESDGSSGHSGLIILNSESLCGATMLQDYFTTTLNFRVLWTKLKCLPWSNY